MIKPKTKEEWIKIGKTILEERQNKIQIAKTKKFDTVATHGLYDLEQALNWNNASIMEPIYMTTAQAYHDSNELEAALAYEMPTWCYTRIANPSSYFLEETAALLETYGSDIVGSCVATGSGMAAIKTATDPLLIVDKSLPAPNFVASAKVYGGTFQQFWVRRWEEQGIEVRWVCDPTNLEEWESKIDKGTRFLYGEFPSNPAVGIFDIEKVADLAHSNQIPLIVDTTCASPALTRPLTLGADIAIQSASKVIGASGYAIAGLMTSKPNIPSKVGPDEMKADFALWTKLWPFRDNGPAIAPMAAIMILNDMRSLRMKVKTMSENALKVAQYLEKHPKVERVHYPGLETYPAHALAKQYMKLADTEEHHYGYMLACEIKEADPTQMINARTFYDNLKMIWRATDLGRVKTVATLNAISTHSQQGEEGRKIADIKPSTCRISAGIENSEDIIEDLEQALNKI